MCFCFSWCSSKSSSSFQTTAIVPPASNQRKNSIVPMNTISLSAMRAMEDLKEPKPLEIKAAKVMSHDLRDDFNGMSLALNFLIKTHDIKTELKEIAVPLWHLGKNLKVVIEDFVIEVPVDAARFDKPYDSVCELIKGIEIVKQKKILLLDEEKECLSCFEEAPQNMISTLNGVDDSRKFSLTRLLREIRWLKAAEYKNVPITLIFNSILPETVQGNAARLKRILNTLVANAVDLTKEGAILIAVEIISQSHTKVICRFEVQNTEADTHESTIQTESPLIGNYRELITSMNRDTTTPFLGTTSDAVWFTVPLETSKD